MALSAFDDPTTAPTQDALRAVLGPAAAQWTELVAETRRIAGDVTETWSCTGAKTGWSMRLIQGTRVLAYLTPQAGSMLVGVVLGEKAIGAASAAGLVSERTLEILEAAPRYAEGRGVRVQVRAADDLAVATELLRIKVSR